MKIAVPKQFLFLAGLCALLSSVILYVQDLRVQRFEGDPPVHVALPDEPVYEFEGGSHFDATTTHAHRRAREASSITDLPCASLYPSMLCCVMPAIDQSTQQAVGCSPQHKVIAPCFARPGVVCEGKTSTVVPPNTTAAVGCDGLMYLASTSVVNVSHPCRYVSASSPKDFDTALALSVFLGMFGADRFYLGYPAIGLAKLCTFGFLCIGQLLDIILIALQIVGPADGSAYRMPHYGPHVRAALADNATHLT